MSNLLASSYYLIYSSNEDSKHLEKETPGRLTVAAEGETGEITTTTTTTTATTTTRTDQFWEEFEWTPNEKNKVIQLLQKHETKCNIIDNAITPQRGRYIVDKYDRDAQTHWNNFYSSHETKFFKDRHYLHKAFPDDFGVVYGGSGKDGQSGSASASDIVGAGDEGEGEGSCNEAEDDSDIEMNSGGNCAMESENDDNENDEDFTITEIGCGVGNTVLPLLELDPFISLPASASVPISTLKIQSGDESTSTESESKNFLAMKKKKRKKRLVIWGLDFSPVAVGLMKQDERFINASLTSNCRARAQVWDITSTHPKDIISTTTTTMTTAMTATLSSSSTTTTTTAPTPTLTIEAPHEIDLHQQQLVESHCLESSSNISLLLFVLSAISPEKMQKAAKNVAASLKPGGVLLLRDYGRYDEAQIKLATCRNKRLSNNFYVKHDGTRCYYFTTEDIERLFGKRKKDEVGGGHSGDSGGGFCVDEDTEEEGAGLEVLEIKYVQRVYRNRADDATRRRVWVQARFRKPYDVGDG